MTKQKKLTTQQIEEIINAIANASSKQYACEREKRFWLSPETFQTKFNILTTPEYTLTINFGTIITLTVQTQRGSKKVNSLQSEEFQKFLAKWVPPTAVEEVVNQLNNIAEYYSAWAEELRQKGNKMWENPCPKLISRVTRETATSVPPQNLLQVTRELLVKRFKSLASVCYQKSAPCTYKFKDSQISLLDMLAVDDFMTNIQRTLSKYGPLTPEYALELFQWLDEREKELMER